MIAIWTVVQCSSHLLTSWKMNESLGGNYLGFCATSENPPEVSWNKTWQKLCLIVKKKWRSIVTFWKNVFASCWIQDSVLTSVVDFGNFLAPSTSAFYPFSPATPCMTIFIYSITILGKLPPGKAQFKFWRKVGCVCVWEPLPNGMWEFLIWYKPFLGHLICTII